MASVRQQIEDAIISALQAATTSFAYVSQKNELWSELSENQFPAVLVITSEEDRERFSFLHPTQPDMHAKMNIKIIGYTRDLNVANTSGLEAKSENLISAIETCLTGSTALDDLTLDIVPVKFVTDNGTIPTYGLVHYEWMARYVYNHASP